MLLFFQVGKQFFTAFFLFFLVDDLATRSLREEVRVNACVLRRRSNNITALTCHSRSTPRWAEEPTGSFHWVSVVSEWKKGSEYFYIKVQWLFPSFSWLLQTANVKCHSIMKFEAECNWLDGHCISQWLIFCVWWIFKGLFVCLKWRIFNLVACYSSESSLWSTNVNCQIMTTFLKSFIYIQYHAAVGLRKLRWLLHTPVIFWSYSSLRI